MLIIIQALVDLIACITPQSEMISGVAICWITVIIRLSTSLGSLFLTFIIAVDRYVTVCRPFGRHLSKTQAVIIATASLAFSLLVNLATLGYFKVIDSKIGGLHLGYSRVSTTDFYEGCPNRLVLCCGGL